ncbi:hypothetical protein [Serratia liquefaciens]|uniref:hypothetical protein n=1 Tax=Serratia liquefaciens TaxID=614 RepID=UPI00380B2580
MKKNVLCCFFGIAGVGYIAMGSAFAAPLGSVLATQTLNMVASVQNPSSLSLSWEPNSALVAPLAKGTLVGNLDIEAKGQASLVIRNANKSESQFMFSNGSANFGALAYKGNSLLTPSSDGNITVKTTEAVTRISFKTIGTVADIPAGNYTDTIVVDSYSS